MERRAHSTQLQSDFVIIYPVYAQFIRGLSTVVLSARSLVIKACQAQCWPNGDRESALRDMIVRHPDVVINTQSGAKAIALSEIIPFFEIDLEDPLESAIILDICRGLPLPEYEIEEARLASWAKEITLAQGTGRQGVVNWDVIFDSQFHTLPLFPDIEPNPNMAHHLLSRLRQFRIRVANRRFYPRATHKNMSRDTRRKFEEQFHDLEDVTIFGQDNWGRVYHETGVQLGGCCEMRQKWYPSGIKPRTYFAMGGTAYRYCRHLQDFFSSLVDWFVPTNHNTRLQPDRLSIDPSSRHGNVHFRIYDMSNFTSNMAEQAPFMRYLSAFFRGVDVEIVDELEGLYVRDLGDMLEEYCTYCVEEPELSIERFQADMEGYSFGHGVASLLGIFGNLMSCTLAHYLIMSPLVYNDEEINIAGDDGIIPEDELDTLTVQTALDVVGSCAREKTFRGDEEGAICLKRPFVENLPGCITTFNLTPPTVTIASGFLSGRMDQRYSHPGLQELSVNKRISVVGRDLIRFLRSAFLRGYGDQERLSNIYRNFGKLVFKYTGLHPLSNLGSYQGYYWPIDPLSYDFLSISPAHCLALYRSEDSLYADRLEVVPDVATVDYRDCGSEFESNMTPKLKLLERLGYIEGESQRVVLSGISVVRYWSIVLSSSSYVPAVYNFVVVKDIPSAFVDWE